jgi:hypothetical protein
MLWPATAVWPRVERRILTGLDAGTNDIENTSQGDEVEGEHETVYSSEDGEHSSSERRVAVGIPEPESSTKVCPHKGRT